MVDPAVKAARPAFLALTLRASIDGSGAARGWLVDLLVAVVAIAIAVVARIVIEQVAGGVIPFVLTFPATIAATLLAGARAGTLTATGCQLLTVRFVFPHWTATHGGQPTDIANLILSTASLGLVIWAAASYRALSARLRAQCEREVETLSLLIAEMDHRTKNNFQIAASLLADQSRATANEEVVRELGRAASRLQSIASVYRNLSLVAQRTDELELHHYLADVVDLMRHGIVPDRISVSLESPAYRVAPQTAMMIGLIVNEWITNAVKYAFGDGDGHVLVDVRREARALVVLVADDGRGPARASAQGGGSRLIAGLAKAIDATVSVEHDGGTRCLLRVADRKG